MSIPCDVYTERDVFFSHYHLWKIHASHVRFLYIISRDTDQPRALQLKKKSLKMRRFGDRIAIFHKCLNILKFTSPLVITGG